MYYQYVGTLRGMISPLRFLPRPCCSALEAFAIICSFFWREDSLAEIIRITEKVSIPCYTRIGCEDLLF